MVCEIHVQSQNLSKFCNWEMLITMSKEESKIFLPLEKNTSLFPDAHTPYFKALGALQGKQLAGLAMHTDTVRK